jgi:hypothetical protein
MAAFDEFMQVLQKELVEFAQDSWKEYKAAAVKDGKSFLEMTKSDLERWTRMLIAGDLTRDDFEWLMIGKKDLAELVFLKRKGLSKVALDRFINGLIDTIVATTFKTLL